MQPTPQLIKPVPSLPTKREMIFNLTQSVKDALTGYIQTGNVLAESAVIDSRMDTCIGCEAFIANQIRCGKCGCYLNAKVRLSHAKCPINKW